MQRQKNKILSSCKLYTELLFNFGPFWPKVKAHKHQISLLLTVVLLTETWVIKDAGMSEYLDGM